MNIENIAYLIKYTKNLNLLYIEDNDYVKIQTVKMLNSFFNNIDIASNGKEAFDIFNTNNSKYDLIITDIKMPILDGISFIELVRKSNKKIPIVVFSAHDDKDYFLKTINAGIDGYILKPYTINQIALTLFNIIEKYNFKEQDSSIVYLENDFIWDKSKNQLYKNDELIKLTKSEVTLFEIFINSNSIAKSYEDIQNSIYDEYGDNMKKIRNLVNRLKVKLDYELFETIYSYGYTLKYRKI